MFPMRPAIDDLAACLSLFSNLYPSLSGLACLLTISQPERRIELPSHRLLTSPTNLQYWRCGLARDVVVVMARSSRSDCQRLHICDVAQAQQRPIDLFYVTPCSLGCRRLPPAGVSPLIVSRDSKTGSKADLRHTVRWDRTSDPIRKDPPGCRLLAHTLILSARKRCCACGDYPQGCAPHEKLAARNSRSAVRDPGNGSHGREGVRCRARRGCCTADVMGGVRFRSATRPQSYLIWRPLRRGASSVHGAALPPRSSSAKLIC